MGNCCKRNINETLEDKYKHLLDGYTPMIVTPEAIVPRRFESPPLYGSLPPNVPDDSEFLGEGSQRVTANQRITPSHYGNLWYTYT